MILMAKQRQAIEAGNGIRFAKARANSRRAMLDERGQLRLLAVILLAAVLEYAAVASGYMLPTVYLSPALVLAGLVASPRRDIAAFCAMGFGLQCCARVSAGLPFLAAAAMALCVMMQAGACAVFLRWRLPNGPDGIDLTQARPIIDLTIAALIVAPPVGFAFELWFAHIGAMQASAFPKLRLHFSHHLGILTLIDWVLPHALGIMLFVPLSLGMMGKSIAHTVQWFTRRRLAMLAIMAATSAVIFTTPNPYLLFFVPPLLVAIAIRQGIREILLAIALCLVFASVATAHDTGAITRIAFDRAHQIAFLRCFFMFLFITILPVAATLERNRRLERSLAKSTRFTDQILRNMREVVFRTDRQGRWGYLNAAWLEISGYSVAETLGRPMTALIAGGSDVALGEALARLTSGQVEELHLTKQLIRHSGELRDVEMVIRVLRNDDGSIAGTGGTLRDVTDMRRHLAALENSERRFRELCDTAPIGILRSDLTGRISYVNAMFELTALANRAQMVGGFLRDWLLDPNSFDLAALDLQLGVSGARIEREVEVRDGAGRPRWLTVMMIGDFNEAGEKVGYVAAIADITSRKRLEAELIAARHTAEEGAAAKSAFLANISHEIRTPMNGVIGLTELLLERKLDATSRHYVQLIADSGATMMQLLNGVLDLAKFEAGRMVLADEIVDIRELLGGSLSLMTAPATRKGLKVKLDIASDLPTIMRGDRLRLRQLLANLIGNAVKFTEVGHVTLMATREQDVLVIAVSDSGIGIPKAAQSAVFEEFVQASRTSAGEVQGTGLGLPIARKLAHAMGGTLTLSSEVGQGTTMLLRLPAVFLDDQRKLDRAAPADLSATSLPTGGKLKILVAEDNRTNQIIAAGMLKRLGHSCTIAHDGKQALALVADASAAGAPYDAVLMDMLMPNMDGLEAAKSLRANGYDAKALPIIAVTANAFAEDVTACLAAGMQRHLPKPLQLAALRDALAEVMQSPTASQQPTASRSAKRGAAKQAA